MATGVNPVMKEFHQLMVKAPRLFDGQVDIQLEDQSDHNDMEFVFMMDITPNGGLYKNAKCSFKVTVQLFSYPESPPQIECQNTIYHPNMETGDTDICVNLLSDDWQPEVGLDGCVMAVLFLFYHPQLDDALSTVCTGITWEEFEENLALALRGGEVEGVFFDKLIHDEEEQKEEVEDKKEEEDENMEKEGAENKKKEGAENKEKDEAENKEKEEAENTVKEEAENKEEDEAENKEKEEAENEQEDENKEKAENKEAENKQEDENKEKAENKEKEEGAENTEKDENKEKEEAENREDEEVMAVNKEEEVVTEIKESDVDGCSHSNPHTKDKTRVTQTRRQNLTDIRGNYFFVKSWFVMAKGKLTSFCKRLKRSWH